MNLYDHQERAIDYINAHPYAILAMDMGTGKTAVAIVSAKRKNEKLLVICPSYLKHNWKNEVAMWWPEAIVTVFTKGDDVYYPIDSDVVIVSYSFFKQLETHLIFSWADKVAFDEAHFLKSLEAKRSSAYHKLVYESSIKSCILLTGTPIRNGVHEYYSILCLVSYNPANTSGIDVSLDYEYAEKFYHEFSYMRTMTKYVRDRLVTVTKWVGLKNEDKLKKLLVGKYFRVKLSDCISLPETIYHTIHTDKQVVSKEVAEAFEKFKETGSVDSRIKAKAAIAKVPYTLGAIRELELTRVVVYTHHRESCRLLAEGLGVEPITGEIPPDRRAKIGEAFQRGETDYLVATIDSFSTGINLTSANIMWFNDRSWVSGDNDQAIARIVRNGQKNITHIWDTVGGMVDMKIHATLTGKRDVIARIT